MRGLIIFGLILALYNAVMGAVMRVRFHETPEHVIPKWLWGQSLMFNGLISLAIFGTLLFLCLRLLRRTRQIDSSSRKA